VRYPFAPGGVFLGLGDLEATNLVLVVFNLAQVKCDKILLIQVHLWDIRGNTTMPALDLDLGLTSRINQTRFIGDQLLAMTSAQLVSPFPTEADSRRGQCWGMRSSLKVQGFC
jgi:hypothetical protein